MEDLDKAANDENSDDDFVPTEATRKRKTIDEYSDDDFDPTAATRKKKKSKRVDLGKCRAEKRKEAVVIVNCQYSLKLKLRLPSRVVSLGICSHFLCNN